VRLAVFPQLPVYNRYTEQWIPMWVKELSKQGVTFEMFGSYGVCCFDRNIEYNYFTNTSESIIYECNQIKEFTECINEFTHLLVLDADFPGLTASIIPTYKLMNPKLKCFAYLHAGSYCNGDVYTKTKAIHQSKKQQELAMLMTYDKIFVATQYHKQKVERYFDRIFENVVVTGIPLGRDAIHEMVEEIPFESKSGIFIAGRMEQSNIKHMEEIVDAFPKEKIYHPLNTPPFNNRREFLNFLNKCKVVVSLKTEDTFGLITAETAILGGLPLCPNKFAYPEFLPDDNLLYGGTQELLLKLTYLVSLDKNPYVFNYDKHDKAIKTIVEEMKND